MRYIIQCCIILLLFSSAMALQRKDVSADCELEVVLSSTELNRIKAMSDHIEAIKATPGDTESLLEDGEIYMAINTELPTSVFIKTRSGYTYKIMLVPRDVPAAQVFLYNQEINRKAQGGRDYMRALISAMRLNSEHIGYVREPVGVVSTIDHVNSKLLTRYMGGDYIGEKYQCYANRSGCKKYLEAIPALAKTMSKHTNGSYLLYLVRQNETF